MAIEKENKIINKYKFYLLHATTIKNLKSILKSGFIKLGTDEDVKEKQFGHKINQIYLSLYSDSMKNITQTFQVTILLHPRLLFNYDIAFGRGWGYDCNYVQIKKSDTFSTKYNKIKKIMQYINLPNLPSSISGMGIMEHEISVKKEISLNDYCIGLICYCDEKSKQKIEVLLEKNKLNVPLFFSNKPPSFDMLKLLK